LICPNCERLKEDIQKLTEENSKLKEENAELRRQLALYENLNMSPFQRIYLSRNRKNRGKGFPSKDSEAHGQDKIQAERFIP
jgi:regulator of replication initiation timing